MFYLKNATEKKKIIDREGQSRFPLRATSYTARFSAAAAADHFLPATLSRNGTARMSRATNAPKGECTPSARRRPQRFTVVTGCRTASRGRVHGGILQHKVNALTGSGEGVLYAPARTRSRFSRRGGDTVASNAERRCHCTNGAECDDPPTSPLSRVCVYLYRAD